MDDEILLKTIHYNLNDIKKMLNHTPYIMWIKDNKRQYIYVNKEFEKFVMKHKDNIIGKINEEIFTCNIETILLQEDRTIKERIKSIKEHKIIMNNKTKWIESYMWPLYEKGEKANWIAGISRDITVDKDIQSEMVKARADDKVKGITDELNENKKNNNTVNRIIYDVMKKLNANGISLLLYNEKNNSLIAEGKVGIAKYIPDSYIFKIDETTIDVLLNNNIYEEARNIKESSVWKKYLCNFYDSNITYYLRTYTIKFENKLIGTLNICYSNEIIAKINQQDFIKSVCFRLSFIYITEYLSTNLRNELSKRIKNEKELKFLLNTATDLYGIISIDKEKFSIIKCNNIKESKKHIDINNLTGINVLENNKKTLKESIKKNNGRNLLCTIKDENNNEKYIEFNWHFINETEAIITGRDKTAQLQLEKSNSKLEQAIALDKLKSEFFANLSHEFKTPLNIIITATQLLNSNLHNINYYSDEKMMSYIKLVKQNSYRLLKLINNLIDITILDKGYYELKLCNHNIVQIIEDIVMSLKEYVGDKERNIIFERENEEVILACDAEKIERIMLNLLSNSIKYTDKDGTIKVKVTVDKIKKLVLTSVENDGVSLEEKDAEIIFNRFARADNILTRRCEGSGIGLALVKSLVELHGGKIWLDSKCKNVTKFIFTLPIKKTEEETANTINNKIGVNKIEKCNVEFSDIYSI